MSSPKPTTFERGAVQGIVLDFAEAGDVLPMHDHELGKGHVTIVARGSCLIRYSDGRPEEKHALGAVVDPDFPHEIEALEAGTRIVNVQK